MNFVVNNKLLTIAKKNNLLNENWTFNLSPSIKGLNGRLIVQFTV